MVPCETDNFLQTESHSSESIVVYWCLKKLPKNKVTKQLIYAWHGTVFLNVEIVFCGAIWWSNTTIPNILVLINVVRQFVICTKWRGHVSITHNRKYIKIKRINPKTSIKKTTTIYCFYRNQVTNEHRRAFHRCEKKKKSPEFPQRRKWRGCSDAGFSGEERANKRNSVQSLCYSYVSRIPKFGLNLWVFSAFLFQSLHLASIKDLHHVWIHPD